MPSLAPGAGVLAVARGAAGTVVTRSVARPPLQVLVPRNHGDGVWAYLSSLGGGLVDGDEIALDVEVGAGAVALLATQASTKAYRAPRGCRQRIAARVGAGGVLVVLPDPVSCFAGARLAQRTEIELASDASLLLIDAVTCGRAARGERWELARYRSDIAIRREGALVLHDAIELDAADGDVAPRLGRFDALATLIALGPRARLAEPPSPTADWVAAASPVAGGTLIRAAATSAQRLHAGIRAALIELPALLGDDPFARKW